jgi:hypothetical protein
MVPNYEEGKPVLKVHESVSVNLSVLGKGKMAEGSSKNYGVSSQLEGIATIGEGYRR